MNAYVDIGDGFSAGPFKALKARFNVDNLLDRDYLGTITTTTNTPATFRPGRSAPCSSPCPRSSD